MKRDGWTLTVKEKTILHLVDFYPPTDSFEKSFSVTQEGIAGSIGIMRSAVPRAMKELIRDELIEIQLCHVKGLKRRRKCYFISQKGYRAARDMVKRLRNVKVDVMEEEGGETVTRTLGECYEMLHRKIGMVFLVRSFEEVGTIRLYSMNEGPAAPQSAEDGNDVKSIRSNRLPATRYFFGRVRELNEMKEVFADGYRFAVIYGIAGIGKTTLAARFAQTYGPEKVFWHRFYSWDNRRSLLVDIAEFLKELGITELKDFLKQHPRHDDFPLLAREIVRLLEKVDVLFVMDDLHTAAPGIVELLRMLKDACEGFRRARFIICSREKRGFYDVRDTMVWGKVREMELTGLDRDSIRSLRQQVTDSEVGPEELETIMRLSRGHPLAVELMAATTSSTGRACAPCELGEFLEGEILQNLSGKERELLRFLSIARVPVEMDCLFFSGRLERTGDGISLGRIADARSYNWDTITVLLEKKLITRAGDELSSHDVVKDFFHTRTTPEERRNIHLKRASYLYKGISERLPGPEGSGGGRLPPELPERDEERLLAFFHHLREADEFRLIAPAVARLGPMLTLVYRQEELAGFLGGGYLEHLSPEDSSVILAGAGDLEARLGRTEKALDSYTRSLACLFQGTGSDGMRKPVSTGKYLPGKRSWKAAAELFSTLKENGGSLDNGELDRILRTGVKIGRLLLKEGWWTEAGSVFHSGSEIAGSAGMDEFRADYLAWIGWTFRQLGEVERSRQYYDMCFETLLCCDRVPGAVRRNLSEGMSSIRDGQLEEAIVHFERCMNYLECREPGDLSMETTAHVVDHYLQMLLSSLADG